MANKGSVRSKPATLSSAPTIPSADRWVEIDPLLAARFAAAVSEHVCHWATVAELLDGSERRAAALRGCAAAASEIGPGFDGRLVRNDAARALVKMIAAVGEIGQSDIALLTDWYGAEVAGRTAALFSRPADGTKTPGADVERPADSNADPEASPTVGATAADGFAAAEGSDGTAPTLATSGISSDGPSGSGSEAAFEGDPAGQLSFGALTESPALVG